MPPYQKKQRTASPSAALTNTGNEGGGSGGSAPYPAKNFSDLPYEVLSRVLLLSSTNGAVDIARLSLINRCVRSASLSDDLWTVDTVRSLLLRRGGDGLFRRIDPHGCLDAEALTTAIKARGGSVASLAKVLQNRNCCAMNGRCQSPTSYFDFNAGIRICSPQCIMFDALTKLGLDPYDEEDEDVMEAMETIKKSDSYSYRNYPRIVNDGFFASGDVLKVEDGKLETFKAALEKAEDGDTISLEGNIIRLNDTLVLEKAVQIIGKESAGQRGRIPRAPSSFGWGFHCSSGNGVILTASAVRLKNLDIVSKPRSFGFCSTMYAASGATVDLDTCTVSGAPAHGISLSCNGSGHMDEDEPFASLRLVNSLVDSGMYSIYAGGRNRVSDCRDNIFRYTGDFMMEGDYQLGAPLEQEPKEFAAMVRDSNDFEDKLSLLGEAFEDVPAHIAGRSTLTLDFVKSKKKGW